MARSDSEGRKSDRQLIEETAQRSRRTETRVSMICDHLGVDFGGKKPELRGNTLYVHSVKTSLEDIVATVGDHFGPVSVYCGEDYLATVAV